MRKRSSNTKSTITVTCDLKTKLICPVSYRTNQKSLEIKKERESELLSVWYGMVARDGTLRERGTILYIWEGETKQSKEIYSISFSLKPYTPPHENRVITLPQSLPGWKTLMK